MAQTSFSSCSRWQHCSTVSNEEQIECGSLSFEKHGEWFVGKSYLQYLLSSFTNSATVYDVKSCIKCFTLFRLAQIDLSSIMQTRHCIHERDESENAFLFVQAHPQVLLFTLTESQHEIHALFILCMSFSSPRQMRLNKQATAEREWDKGREGGLVRDKR